MDAKRCLNCLSREHFVHNCLFPFKCRVCAGPQFRNKHASALHECLNGMNVGAADRVDPVSRPASAPRTSYRQNGSENFTCVNSILLIIA